MSSSSMCVRNALRKLLFEDANLDVLSFNGESEPSVNTHPLIGDPHHGEPGDDRAAPIAEWSLRHRSIG